MACSCKNKNNIHKQAIPQTNKVLQQNVKSNLPVFNNTNNQDNNGFTSERRRIEKLRREAVRKSLGIG
jgi:hypothetical protein